MIKIKAESKSFAINLPTSLSEITPELLKNLTDNVQLPKYYCIVAMAWKVKLFDFVNTSDNGKVKVFKLMANGSNEDLEKINTKIGAEVIIDNSSLERGTHLNIPCYVCSAYASSYIKSDDKLRKDIITGVFNKPKDCTISKNLARGNSQDIVVLNFKIVPTSEIRGTIVNKISDPFVVEE